MSFTNYLVLFVLVLSGCKGLPNDLNPSGEDKSTSTTTEVAADGETESQTIGISVQTGLGETIDLDQALSGKKAIVLYFTMWCPICNGHTDKLINEVIPNYSNVSYYLVDYVSGTLSDSQISLESSGYEEAPLTLLVDLEREIELKYKGTMGITVVLDANANVLMAEDLKDGVRLKEILAGL